MKWLNKKSIAIIFILAVGIMLLASKKSMAGNIPINYVKTTTTLEKKTYQVNYDYAVNMNQTTFVNALNGQINATNTQAGTSYTYDVSGASTLVSPTNEYGFFQYAKLVNFVPSNDGVNPGTATYKVECVTNSDLIDEIDFSVALPEVGTTIVGDETTPVITLSENANYSVTFSMFVNNFPSVDPSYDDGSMDGKKIEAGKDYYAEIFLAPKDGYQFVFKNDSFPNGVTCTINGAEQSEKGYSSAISYLVFVKMTAEGSVEEIAEKPEDKPATTESKAKTYAFLKGDGRRFNVLYDSGLDFEIDASFDLFENGGLVYIDGELVDSSKYRATAGSTIITFDDDYVKTLESGEHTLKVAFNDEGTATASFYISRADSPKAGDNVEIYVGVVFVATIGCVFIMIRKRL